MKRYVYALAAALIFSGAYYATVGARDAREARSTAAYQEIEGDETMIVFLVSPNCNACNNPKLPEAWDRVVRQVARDAESSGKLTRTAVVLSATPRAGSEFVGRFGDFDELQLGRKWHNSGALKYVYSDFRGPAVVPQIIVLQRSIRKQPDGSPSISDERVIQRRYGLQEIFSWVGM